MREYKPRKKAVEEIKIDGDIFRLNISDNMLTYLQNNYSAIAERLSASDVSMTDIHNSLKEIINAMFFDAPFERLYTRLGGTLEVLEFFKYSVGIVKEQLAL
jgi:hypothetical protein